MGLILRKIVVAAGGVCGRAVVIEACRTSIVATVRLQCVDVEPRLNCLHCEIAAIMPNRCAAVVAIPSCISCTRVGGISDPHVPTEDRSASALLNMVAIASVCSQDPLVWNRYLPPYTGTHQGQIGMADMNNKGPTTQHISKIACGGIPICPSQIGQNVGTSFFVKGGDGVGWG